MVVEGRVGAGGRFSTYTWMNGIVDAACSLKLWKFVFHDWWRGLRNPERTPRQICHS